MKAVHLGFDIVNKLVHTLAVHLLIKFGMNLGSWEGVGLTLGGASASPYAPHYPPKF